MVNDWTPLELQVLLHGAGLQVVKTTNTRTNMGKRPEMVLAEILRGTALAPNISLDERPDGHATIDYLTEHLNDLVRGDFRILRGRDERGQLRYALRADFDGELQGQGHTFQGHRPLPLGELQRWMASICDMAAWGLLRLKKDDIK